MVTGDGAYIKKINRRLILETIIENGTISRADLSKITGLNKATISVQVADLLEAGLILETGPEHNGLGRRPIMLSINPKAGYVLGIDLDYKQISYLVSDLRGKPVERKEDRFETASYEDILTILAKQIGKFKETYSKFRYGLVRVVIGVHGTVNNEEKVHFVPAYQWHNKDLKRDLEQLLGKEQPVLVENNANLSAYAEKIFVHHSSDQLLNILLTSGIGAGMIINGHMQKGYHGFAGEMGHMIIYPNGLPCKCGNRGCWELYASEPAFLKRVGDQIGTDDLTVQLFSARVKEKDPVCLRELDRFIEDLSIGLNNIINIFNPETVVINSDILSDIPEAVRRIEGKLTSNMSQYRKIVLSKLGHRACILGACALGIQRFLDVSKLSLTVDP